MPPQNAAVPAPACFAAPTPTFFVLKGKQKACAIARRASPLPRQGPAEAPPVRRRPAALPQQRRRLLRPRCRSTGWMVQSSYNYNCTREVQTSDEIAPPSHPDGQASGALRRALLVARSVPLVATAAGDSLRNPHSKLRDGQASQAGEQQQ